VGFFGIYMTRKRITDNLDVLLNVLPPQVAHQLTVINRSDDLLEVILDLGRIPTARFLDREETLSQQEVTHTDIDYVVERISAFDTDNRAGMERTLHRIAAIRNRRGNIVGLTCRVGRAVYGTTDIIQDLIESGKSIILLGRPGIGKTTMLRESARLLAEKKRVVIVDTSNEIGGDGDVPHPAVGRARRMQVSTPALQHEVMIEAVENHNPEVIVIDEIGRELEAAAARTIAERGVQLIGTAHGNTLENLLLNPTLSDLVGGIESVTLSDEEARRRGTQKTVLERRSPPTFDILIEIQTRDRLAVHLDVGASVDTLLRGYPTPPEVRFRDESGEIHVEHSSPPVKHGKAVQGFNRPPMELGKDRSLPPVDSRSYSEELQTGGEDENARRTGSMLQAVRIYPYGVARNRLVQAAKWLGVPAVVVNELEEAQALVTLKSYYRNRQRPVIDAENRGMPIYVLRANTVNQMQHFLSDLYNLSTSVSEERGLDPAMQNTQAAIDAVLNGERYVELPPATAYIRRLQHQMARQANLTSHSYGKEPYRRVRIFRD
jgi:stage III sporulation protein SpoIIIAA